MNNPESKHTKAENSEENTMESSVNTSLLMPVALLLVLLVIPFSINSFIHMLVNKNEFVYPVIMKIPLDSIIVTAPTEAKQYERFEIKLNVNTEQLAHIINKISSASSVSKTLQGVTGHISSKMQAEITGKNFTIDNPGPQKQSYLFNDATEWAWQVMPESSGKQTVKINIHVSSTEHGQQKNKIIELAEANIIIDSNASMWMVHNWWVLVLITCAFFGGWKMLRRFNN